MFHASQHLIEDGLKLYFIDDGFQPGGVFANGKVFPGCPDPDSTFKSTKDAPNFGSSSTFSRDKPHVCVISKENPDNPHVISQLALDEIHDISSREEDSSGREKSILACSALVSLNDCKEKVQPPPKINTARNLHMLLELHCALGHRNFADIAKKFGLTLPYPPPLCWACLIGKPRRITPDKVSTRNCTRVSEGIAADAKGPMATTTPEGYRHFFILTCLYSRFVWVAFAKTLSEWEQIWPAFVKCEEARAGKERCVAFVLTDNHKVHTQDSMVRFNEDRGIQTTTAAPYSQWQDPAERVIQTITSSARTSMIHGGGLAWMWKWAVMHAVQALNSLSPPTPIPGHENQSRRQIAYPATTAAKELRCMMPFLCLAIKYILGPGELANFKPRGVPCVCLCYVTTKKSYALLTLPDLVLTSSVECKLIKQSKEPSPCVRETTPRTSWRASSAHPPKQRATPSSTARPTSCAATSCSRPPLRRSIRRPSLPCSPRPLLRRPALDSPALVGTFHPKLACRAWPRSTRRSTPALLCQPCTRLTCLRRAPPAPFIRPSPARTAATGWRAS